MTNTEFVSSLLIAKSTKDHSGFLDHISSASPNRLIEILRLLPKDRESWIKHWQVPSVYERIIKLAGLELGLEQVSIVQQIFHESGRERYKNLMASILCHKHDPIALLDALTASNDKELLQLVVHESLSRGATIKTAKDFHKIENTNSLGIFRNLALETSYLEKENSFPSYSINGSGRGIGFGFRSDEVFQPITRQTVPEVSVIREERIMRAVEHWDGASIGYRGSFDHGTLPEQLVTAIPELSASKGIRMNKITPTHAYSMLFNAAYNGSAYTYGCYGAHGRLHAWTSLNAMVTTDKFSANKKTEHEVTAYDWYEFGTDDWFHNEWLDLGILALNNKQGTFGIIAATDTD